MIILVNMKFIEKEKVIIMINIEKEVPDLKTCMELKKIGFPQKDGHCYWVLNMNLGTWNLGFLVSEKYSEFIFFFPKYGEIKYISKCTELIRAPMNEELNKWLPNGISIKRVNKRVYEICDNQQNKIIDEDELEANIKAYIIIWKYKKGFINFKKNKMLKSNKEDYYEKY